MNCRDMSTRSSGSGGESELREIFRNSSDPVLTAVEVAEKLGITQQAAYSRLSRVEERGEFERKKVGSRAVVWWPADYEPDSVCR